MLVKEAVEDLKRFAAERGVTLSGTAPLALFEVIADWYAGARVDDPDLLEPGGDMLLFQWGTYDWGNGPSFQYDLTRQFYKGTLDAEGNTNPEVWQFHATVHLPATVADRLANGDRQGDRWCHSPSELDAFRRFIRASARDVLANDSPIQVEIGLERV
jgi:hypothetical protein